MRLFESVRALPELIRTTQFKIISTNFFMACCFTAAVIVVVRFTTVNALVNQSVELIDTDLRGLSAAWNTGRVDDLATLLDRRSTNSVGDSLYLLYSKTDGKLAGNLVSWPETMEVAGDQQTTFFYTVAGDDGELEQRKARALTIAVKGVEGDVLLLVGRDIRSFLFAQQQIDRYIVLGAAGYVILGLLLTFVLAYRTISRLNDITRTSRDIMAGDFSRRIPVSKTQDEIDQLTISLNDMLAQIERLMTGMREVTDNVAHDLRSPLNRIRSRLEVMLMKPATEEDYKNALSLTIDDVKHLLGTFNALLSIAQVEAGSPRDRMNRIDIQAIAQDVGELYDPVAECDDVIFEMDVPEGPVLVHGNRELMSQALANLVDNAIKYTPSGGLVRLSLRRNSETGGDVEVAVADTGPGIPEADRERVLKRFVRLEASRSAPGSGLGLSLVAAVAKLHDGALKLDASDIEPSRRHGQLGLKTTLRIPTVA